MAELLGGVDVPLTIDMAQFVGALRESQASLNSFAAQVNTRLASMDKGFTGVSNNMFGMSRLFNRLSAGALALSAISFGRNIANNFEDIERRAQRLGIEVDQNVARQMESATSRMSAAWLRLQLAVAPVVANITTLIAQMAEAATGSAGTIAEMTSRMESLRRITPAEGGGRQGAANRAAAAELERQIAQQAQAQINARQVELYNQEFVADPKLRSAGIQKGAEEARERERAVEKAVKDNQDALASIDEMERWQAEQHNRRLSEQAREDTRRLEQLGRANERLSNTVQRMKDRDLETSLNASIEEFREYERIENEKIRRAEQFSDLMRTRVIGDISQMGASALLGAESFGQAMKRMVASVAHLIVQMQIARALEEGFGGGGKAGGPNFVSSLLTAGKVLFGMRAEGGPVSAGKPYVVGERGPELFVPGASGTIVPNGAAGNTNITVNVVGARGNAEIHDMVAAGVSSGLAAYDRALPSRVIQVVSDPRMR